MRTALVTVSAVVCVLLVCVARVEPGAVLQLILAAGVSAGVRDLSEERYERDQEDPASNDQ